MAVHANGSTIPGLNGDVVLHILAQTARADLGITFHNALEALHVDESVLPLQRVYIDPILVPLGVPVDLIPSTFTADDIRRIARTLAASFVPAHPTRDPLRFVDTEYITPNIDVVVGRRERLLGIELRSSGGFFTYERAIASKRAVPGDLREWDVDTSDAIEMTDHGDAAVDWASVHEVYVHTGELALVELPAYAETTTDTSLSMTLGTIVFLPYWVLDHPPTYLRIRQLQSNPCQLPADLIIGLREVLARVKYMCVNMGDMKLMTREHSRVRDTVAVHPVFIEHLPLTVHTLSVDVPLSHRGAYARIGAMTDLRVLQLVLPPEFVPELDLRQLVHLHTVDIYCDNGRMLEYLLDQLATLPTLHSIRLRGHCAPDTVFDRLHEFACLPRLSVVFLMGVNVVAGLLPLLRNAPNLNCFVARMCCAAYDRALYEPVRALGPEINPQTDLPQLQFLDAYRHAFYRHADARSLLTRYLRRFEDVLEDRFV